MKSVFKLLLSSCSALLLSGFAATAGAQWQTVGPLHNVDAQQAVSINGTIYILGGPPGLGGYHLKNPGYIGNNVTSWNNVGDTIGTSITSSPNSNLWLVNGYSDVWELPSSGAWALMPSNTCEGPSNASNHITIDQPTPDIPHNTIAAGTDANGSDVVFVVSSGTLRQWNGSCWAKMANLPSGATVQDVGIDSTHGTTLPWVVATDQSMFRWNGSSWLSIPTSGSGLNSKADSISALGNTIWRFNGSTSSRLTSWSYTTGTIRSLGIARPYQNSGVLYNQPSQILVTADGMVWANNDPN